MHTPRYKKVYDCPDEYTCDVVYIDRLTGKEIIRYDGADPANTNTECGGISDSDRFLNRGLDKHEKVVDTDVVSDNCWSHRYTEPSY